MENVEAGVTEEGIPVSFVRDGRTWRVAAEPLRWYERIAWWETAHRMPRGGTARMDIEVWRVQARIGHNPKSPLVTFERIHDRDADSWAVRARDAVAA